MLKQLYVQTGLSWIPTSRLRTPACFHVALHASIFVPFQDNSDLKRKKMPLLYISNGGRSLRKCLMGFGGNAVRFFGFFFGACVLFDMSHILVAPRIVAPSDTT